MFTPSLFISIKYLYYKSKKIKPSHTFIHVGGVCYKSISKSIAIVLLGFD